MNNGLMNERIHQEGERDFLRDILARDAPQVIAHAGAHFFNALNAQIPNTFHDGVAHDVGHAGLYQTSITIALFAFAFGPDVPFA